MVNISLVNHSDRLNDLIDLFAVSFGKRITESAWKWKYVQNPLSTKENDVIVAFDKNKIVGARPFMLAELWINDKKEMAAQHCDTMVHPDFQRKGIFSKMGKFSFQYLERQGFALSYGFPNSLSRRGFLKQGYEKLVETEILFKVLNPQIVSAKIKNSFLAKSGYYFYRKFLDHNKCTLSKESENFTIKEFERVDKEVAKVYNLRSRSLIDLVRSEDYLRWRFDSNPKYNYKYILAKRNDEVAGFTVVSPQQISDGLVHGTIVDHQVRNSESACYEALIDRSVFELEKQNCDIVVIWAMGEPELKKLLKKKFGFKSSIHFPYNRFFSYLHMDVIQINSAQTNEINIYDPKNWRVTHAFHDVA